MKKILMISYFYPPLSDVGGLRALAYSRHLREFEWEPYVVSVKNPDKHWCVLGTTPPPEGVKTYYTRSLMNLTWLTGKLNGLMARILRPFGITVTRPVVGDLLCIPDQFIGWIPLTVLKGLKLIKANRIDVIYVSCKPFSSALIGLFLKLLTKKPLVLDFRDPVSPLFLNSNDKYYRRMPTFRIIKKIEEITLKHADKLILVTEETRDLYGSFFPFLANKMSVIYNGFMEEYFLEKPAPFERFTIVYSGNFYQDFIPPDPFFQALNKIATEDETMKKNIDFMYVGARTPWLTEMTKKYNLQDLIRVTGFVSREKSIEFICRSSVLLLRIVPGMISTKLFEGLAAGAPILALIHEGEAARLIRKYSCRFSFIVEPNEPDKIAVSIKNAYEKWQRGELKGRRNPEFYRDFNKRNLTSVFAQNLEQVVSDQKSEGLTSENYVRHNGHIL
jgi:glycosyltransferase involved in cell wall biosynthesis